MNYLFSEGSLAALESLAFTRTLFAFDFDGTLAPIVDRPDDARMAPRTVELFARLAERVPTAVISGRSLADLKSRVPVPKTRLVGNHGLEGLGRSGEEAESRRQCVAWERELRRRLLVGASARGIELEPKGLSLALHYRKSRRRRESRRLALAAASSLRPAPRLIGGKLVLNVVPPLGPHKGIAMQRLLEGGEARFGLYVGDDVTDEDVFALGDPAIMSVRVGQSQRSEAKYFLRRRVEVDRLLRSLLRFHGIPER